MNDGPSNTLGTPGGENGQVPAFSDQRSLGIRIKELRRGMQLTQVQFCNLLGTSQPTVSRWETGLFRPQDIQFLAVMANMAGVSLAEFRYGASGTKRELEVIGTIGAGGTVQMVSDDRDSSERELVIAPSEVENHPAAALRVVGNSLMPLLRNGWLLFYRTDAESVPAECLGKMCVVRIADGGAVLVKDVLRGVGKGTFHLLGDTSDPMDDVRLDWATRVLSIRPS